MQKEKVITVGTWAAQWLDTRYDGWGVHTQKGYRNLVEHHIFPGIGRASLGKLNVQRIERFYKALADKGLGAQSIWCVHLLLRRMLDEACRTGQIAFNPAALSKLPQGVAHEASRCGGGNWSAISRRRKNGTPCCSSISD